MLILAKDFIYLYQLVTKLEFEVEVIPPPYLICRLCQKLQLKSETEL